MLNIYKTVCLPLLIVVSVSIVPSAQIARAPLASERANVSSTTANGSPQDTAAGKLQDLRIGIGDLLQITMFCTQDFNSDFRVSSSGDISLPPLGMVHVAGLSTSEAERLIERQLVEGGFYREPRVSVFAKEYAT